MLLNPYRFSAGIDPSIILLDTFTGVSGALTAHTPETGLAWALTGANSWQLDGSGSIVNASAGTVDCENLASVLTSSPVVELDMTMTTPGSGVSKVTFYLADSPDWNNYVGGWITITSAGVIEGSLDANSPTIAETSAATSLGVSSGVQFTLKLEYSSTQIVMKVDDVTKITLPYGGTIDMTGGKFDIHGNVLPNYSISRVKVTG